MVSFDDIIDIFPEVFPREKDSVFRRYVEAHQDETDNFGARLDEIRQSHFVDQAEGEDLDRIGAMFGPLGNREGRDDQEYRIYLKSVVQAYKGAGTVPGIKSAVSAALNIDEEEDIEIEEHFQDLEYTIILYNWPDHRGSTVEELADLSDASVANLRRIRYKFSDESESGDTVSITEGHQVHDEALAGEESVVNPHLTTVEELVGTGDETLINPNLLTIADESLGGDAVSINKDKLSLTEEANTGDAAAVNQHKTSVSDASSGVDDVATDVRTVVWDSGDWDTMRWQ